MAVSSLVSCSLSSSITRASPCMGLLLVLGCQEASGSRDRGDLQAVEGIGRPQPVADPLEAVAAAGARAAGVPDLLLRARTVVENVCQLGLADGEADADVHGDAPEVREGKALLS